VIKVYHTQKFGIPWKSTSNVIFYRNFNTDFEGLLAFTRTIFKTSTFNSAIVDVEADSDNYNIYTDAQILPTQEIDFDEEVMESIRLYIEYIEDLFDDGKLYSEIGTGEEINDLVYFDKKDMTVIGFEYEGTFLNLYINNEIVESSDYIQDIVRQIEDETLEILEIKLGNETVKITKI